MPDQDDPLSPIKKPLVKLLVSWGWIGALLFLASLILWNWDHVSALPGVRQLLDVMERPSIQRVSDDHLTVAVANLENDPEQKNKKLLLAELEKFAGLSLQSISRVVELPSAATQPESIAQGHEQARALLAQSGAHALIWGNVLDPRQFHLRWTVAKTQTGYNPLGRYQPDTDLNLPPVFWTDLTKVLGLVVQTQLAAFHSQGGTCQADKLQSFSLARGSKPLKLKASGGLRSRLIACS